MKIYLAGAENEDSDFSLFDKQFTNVFCSFYYMKDKQWDRITRIRPNTDKIIVDSGAHSFFSETDASMSASAVKKKKTSNDTPDVYFQKYLKWLKAWKDYIDYFVELDIGELVGQDKVMAWRAMLRAEGLFHKCITVYHPKVMSYEDYLRDLDNSVSRYVALEGDRGRRQRLPYLPLVKAAYERKCRVHGFALVKEDICRNYPFYSVDSNSWKAGARFGMMMVWQKDKMCSVSVVKDEGNLYNQIGRIKNIPEIHNQQVKQKNRDKRYEISIMSYREMEKYFTEYWRVRGVDWDKQLEGVR